MRPRKPILLYCTDRDLLSSMAFVLRLKLYDVTAVENSRNAAAIMMASPLVCGVLVHAGQGDLAGRLIHRLLEADLHLPLLLVDRTGNLAPVRYADAVLYGQNTSMAHILSALDLLCSRKHRNRIQG